MTSPLNLPPLREVIAQHKLAADKSFGQHFLLDMNITDKIARAAGPLDGVHVLEIGPGPGGLTRSLLNAGAQKVSVIEMDGRFVPALMDLREASGDRLHIEMGDGVKIDPVSLGNVTRIAANLPYNVGTKMLINWLTAKPIFWNRLVLMFQKEVAERVTAEPGDKAYGRLAVLAQTVARAHMLMDVPAKCFSPPPKVDSAVIVLEPLDVDQRFEDLETLGQITAACFGMRRKMLRRSLKPFAAKHNIELETWLTQAQISPQQRPETVTPKQFQTLATTLVQTS